MILIKNNFLKVIKVISFVLIVLLVIFLCEGYHQDPNKLSLEHPNRYTHQYITNESLFLWSLRPYELRNYVYNSLSVDLNNEMSYDSLITCSKEDAKYSSGNDILTGSGEEDNTRSTCSALFSNHYWDPDYPEYIDLDPFNMYEDPAYNAGLLTRGSNFRKALNYWKTNIIPNYLKEDKENRSGDRNEAL